MPIDKQIASLVRRFCAGCPDKDCQDCPLKDWEKR
jgi:hypothetical protein